MGPGRKPNSVSRVRETAISLGPPLPVGSSGLPATLRRADQLGRLQIPQINPEGQTSLFGLARGGVFRARPVTRSGGALLPHLFTLT